VTGRTERGQAAVELALVLPLLVVLLLVIVQVGLVIRDEVLVIHAARSAAREAALGTDRGQVAAAALAASGLDRRRLTVTSAVAGQEVVVTVSYRSVPIVPVLSRLVREVRLQETCRLALEASPRGGPPEGAEKSVQELRHETANGSSD